MKLFGYAAKPIADRLKKKGGELTIPPEGVYVKGTEGPLKEGELERAADWLRAYPKTSWPGSPARQSGSPSALLRIGSTGGDIDRGVDLSYMGEAWAIGAR